MSANEALALLSRAMHIVSVVTLAGGMIFSWLVLKPVGQVRHVEKFGPAAVMAIVGLLASGLYNVLTKVAVQPGYHAVFGIKFILALHVIAMAFLSTRPGVDDTRRSRLVSSGAISSFAVIVVSAWLRTFSR